MQYEDLAEALKDPDGEARISAIWALGSSGDASIVPKLQPLYESPDQGIRKMVVYALGALPGVGAGIFSPERAAPPPSVAIAITSASSAGSSDPIASTPSPRTPPILRS